MNMKLCNIYARLASMRKALRSYAWQWTRYITIGPIEQYPLDMDTWQVIQELASEIGWHSMHIGEAFIVIDGQRHPILTPSFIICSWDSVGFSFFFSLN
jgi:hypothetical protein